MLSDSDLDVRRMKRLFHLLKMYGNDIEGINFTTGVMSGNLVLSMDINGRLIYLSPGFVFDYSKRTILYKRRIRGSTLKPLLSFLNSCDDMEVKIIRDCLSKFIYVAFNLRRSLSKFSSDMVVRNTVSEVGRVGRDGRDDRVDRVDKERFISKSQVLSKNNRYLLEKYNDTKLGLESLVRDLYNKSPLDNDILSLVKNVDNMLRVLSNSLYSIEKTNVNLSNVILAKESREFGESGESSLTNDGVKKCKINNGKRFQKRDILLFD